MARVTITNDLTKDYDRNCNKIRSMLNLGRGVHFVIYNTARQDHNIVGADYRDCIVTFKGFAEEMMRSNTPADDVVFSFIPDPTPSLPPYKSNLSA